MEMNERMEQLETRIAWLEKLKAEDERAILILHEQNENLQRQIEEIKERLGKPDAKRDAGVKAERTRQDVMKEITSGILWDGENALRCCPKLVDPAVVCRGREDKCQECRREYWMEGTKTNDRCEGQTTPKENAGNDGERKNEPSAPEFLCAEAMKKTLQDEPVLRVIASLTLGPEYERKMEMAREHVEKGTEEESRNVLELMVALTDKVDRLAEKIKVAEKMIEESRCVTDATFGEVDEWFAEVEAQIERVDERITLCMQMNGGTKKRISESENVNMRCSRCSRTLTHRPARKCLI